ncbi:DUF4259 domain-containing protein [Nocardioides lianchengensis]|uniref:DUF4259 domain-containing protein n=1 Tax=Nocardioides lianchengensis TaxID=1045774 RepID=UPI000B8767BC|nr:DUF4259 domain-containing protein [Nocardioides lianchengensis]NYG12588.1 hypothetical protein [Nocardioides lianchengensis]
MGAWGPAIFSDDTACDIRDAYRQQLEDQVPDREATQRTIDAYAHLADDEKHVLWLALAAVQSQLGRLDEEVKAEAIQVIDSGVGLELWAEAGASSLAKRKAALTKLRETLSGPQPARKTVKRPWRDDTELRAGDVLSFESRDSLRLLRVLRVDDDRVGAAPILALLDWDGSRVPSDRKLRRLKIRMQDHVGPMRPDTHRVARHRKKDPDWTSLGFTLVAHQEPRPEDSGAAAWSYTDWTGLVTLLKQEPTS